MLLENPDKILRNCWLETIQLLIVCLGARGTDDLQSD